MTINGKLNSTNTTDQKDSMNLYEIKETYTTNIKKLEIQIAIFLNEGRSSSQKIQNGGIMKIKETIETAKQELQKNKKT